MHDPILARIFTKILYSPFFFGPLPAMTLTFDLWSQKLITTPANPNTSVTKIWSNFLHWVVRYGMFTMFSAHFLLWQDVWSFDLISMSKVMRHRPLHHQILVKLAEIFTTILYSPGFCGSLPPVTPTFDFLAPKSNQRIYECKYICDQNWMKLPSLVWEIWCRPPAVTLTFDLLT